MILSVLFIDGRKRYFIPFCRKILSLLSTPKNSATLLYISAKFSTVCSVFEPEKEPEKIQSFYG